MASKENFQELLRALPPAAPASSSCSSAWLPDRPQMFIQFYSSVPSTLKTVHHNIKCLRLHTTRISSSPGMLPRTVVSIWSQLGAQNPSTTFMHSKQQYWITWTKTENIHEEVMSYCRSFLKKFAPCCRCRCCCCCCCHLSRRLTLSLYVSNRRALRNCLKKIEGTTKQSAKQNTLKRTFSIFQIKLSWNLDSARLCLLKSSSCITSARHTEEPSRWELGVPTSVACLHHRTRLTSNKTKRR